MCWVDFHGFDGHRSELLGLGRKTFEETGVVLGY